MRVKREILPGKDPKGKNGGYKIRDHSNFTDITGGFHDKVQKLAERPGCKAS